MPSATIIPFSCSVTYRIQGLGCGHAGRGQGPHHILTIKMQAYSHLYERTIMEEQEIIVYVSNYISSTLFLSDAIPYCSVKITLKCTEHLSDRRPGTQWFNVRRKYSDNLRLAKVIYMELHSIYLIVFPGSWAKYLKLYNTWLSSKNPAGLFFLPTMTFSNKQQNTWFLHPATGLVFAIHEKCMQGIFPTPCFLRISFLIAKEMHQAAQGPRGTHTLVCSTVCYAPHNVSHYSSWLYLCSLVEALKINEAFVLNQEAVYEYSSSYNKLCRLLFLSLHYQGGGRAGSEGMLFIEQKGEEWTGEGKEKDLTFLAYKQSLTEKPPHHNYAVKKIDILQRAVLFG